MSHVHLVVGLLVVTANASAALWGFRDWRRGRPSPSFWPLARLAQAAVAVQVLLGLLLAGGGTQPPSGWHLLAGLSALAAVAATETARSAATSRLLRERGEGARDPGALAGGGRSSADALTPELRLRVALRETAVTAAGSVTVFLFAVLAVLASGVT